MKEDSLEIRSRFLAFMGTFTRMGARVRTILRDEGSDSDVEVQVDPLNEAAASINARIDFDFGVYLWCGVRTEFEIPFRGGYHTKTDWFTELTLICNAVAAGRLFERLVYEGEDLKSCHFNLILDDGSSVDGSWGIAIDLPWKRRSTVEKNYVHY